MSLPEKTFEHWVSQYVLFRFRSKAQVWWPPYGVDIDVRNLPRRPGKALLLELKTTHFTSGGHEVQIDLKQLAKYAAEPLGRQPFYVFPLPRWSGAIEEFAAATWRRALPAPELGFLRSGDRWFGYWTAVLTTGEVAGCMKDALDAQAATTMRLIRPLVRIDPTLGNLTWFGTPTLPPVPLPWRTFWDQFLECGNSDWPQLFIIDREAAAGRDRMSYDEVRTALGRSIPQEIESPNRRTTGVGETFEAIPRAMPEAQSRRDLRISDADVVCFEPIDHDAFRIRDLDASVDLARQPSTIGHRASAFIDAEVLKQT